MPGVLSGVGVSSFRLGGICNCKLVGKARLRYDEMTSSDVKVGRPLGVGEREGVEGKTGCGSWCGCRLEDLLPEWMECGKRKVEEGETRLQWRDSEAATMHKGEGCFKVKV